MAKVFGPKIKKLQRAINDTFDEKILINKTQFFSDTANRPLEYYVIKKAVWDENNKKYRNVELFSSASDIQIILWLRDFWYILNKWPVPTDNKEWLEAKEKYERTHEMRK